MQSLEEMEIISQQVSMSVNEVTMAWDEKAEVLSTFVFSTPCFYLLHLGSEEAMLLPAYYIYLQMLFCRCYNTLRAMRSRQDGYSLISSATQGDLRIKSKSWLPGLEHSLSLFFFFWIAKELRPSFSSWLPGLEHSLSLSFFELPRSCVQAFPPDP
jgi:hypothetical protein